MSFTGAHNVRCHKCNKPISGQYVRAFDKVWHNDCFLCAGCKKPIRGQFLKKAGQPWHPHCFQKAFIPNCDVCSKPLTDRYLQDYWGNKYCATHKNYATCTSCHRVVCGPITDGGMRFPDGLTICHLCTRTGVTTQAKAEILMNEMKEALKGLGLNLFQADTPIRLADRDELHANSRHNNHDEHPLLGLAKWSTSYVGKRIVGRQFEEIIIQTNLPEDHFRTIAIHELGHAWFFYNNPLGKKLPLFVEEGLCVLLEYLWLKKLNTEDAKFRIKLIESSPDPIYGKGFRAARKALKHLSLSSLVRYSLDKGRFPSAIAAFFYN